MNEARFKTLFDGVSSIAQKVYGAVPISEGWTPAQIHTELTRLGGSSDRRVLQGCLRALAEARLIRELSGGKYIRVEVRAKATQPDDEEEYFVPEAAPKQPPAMTAKFSQIAAKANAMAEQLRSLADEIELATLEIEDHMAANSADSAKLKQLQTLLKSLS